MEHIWTEDDECSAIALGELMDEWIAEHGGDFNQAFDAVQHLVMRRADEVYRQRHSGEEAAA